MIFVSCATSVNVSTDYDRETNFNVFKTYTFHDSGIEKLRINDLDKRRILTAIENELNSKGLTKSSTDADLKINILASSSSEVRVDNNDYYGSYGYYGWRRAAVYGPPMTSTVSTYTAGKLMIDLIDEKNNMLVWQGVASDLDVTDVSNKADKIPVVVNKILENFPPKP